jgi:hypothetical protein
MRLEAPVKRVRRRQYHRHLSTSLPLLEPFSWPAHKCQ